MGKKKVILSVTAGAAIASGLFGANEAEAASHKVQSGESLWSIAQKYNTSVSKLVELNNLSSDRIYPAQILETGTKEVEKTTKAIPLSKPVSISSTYIVKSGDTLSGIALRHNISVRNLKEWNNLTSSLIFPGDALVVGEQGTDAVSDSKTKEKKTEKVEEKTEEETIEKTDGSSSNTKTTTTYTVKSGDTLSKIAYAHNLSVKELMSMNKLNTTLIYPGDRLTVNETAKSQPTKSEPPKTETEKQPESKTPSSEKTETVYTVRAGDSLWKISNTFGVTVSNLKKWNSLSSDNLYIGQKLKIKGSTVKTGSNSNTVSGSNTKPKTDDSYDVNKLISTAKQHLGVPYVWGGATPSGFDCSGYIYYVYKAAGMDVKRTNAEGYFDRSYYVDKPQIGDLVFFEGTYKRGISHVGIYVGNNEFISATSSGGVSIVSLDNPYWSKHFDSFKRFY